MSDLVVVHESEREYDSYGGSNVQRLVRIWKHECASGPIYYKQYGSIPRFESEVEWEKTMTPTTGKEKTVVIYEWDED